MSDHYEYMDAYYRSSHPDGESVDSGATRFNYGAPCSHEGDYGFGQALASGFSASVFAGPSQMSANMVKFCAVIAVL